MATFIDRHSAEAVPIEALCRLIQEAEEHQLDQRGVRLVGESHAEQGLTCADLHQIEGVHDLCPGSADVHRRVREAIAGSITASVIRA